LFIAKTILKGEFITVI